MEVVAVNGNLRKEVGKKATKAVRTAEEIPCVLYGGKNVMHFTTKLNDVKDVIYTPNFKIAEIKIDGQVYKTILKDTQFHPVSDQIIHLDFFELVAGKKVNVEIPLRFKGVAKAPGTSEGGILLPNLRRVTVKTTPEHLVDELILDVSMLELGQAIRVRDIKVGDEMEIMNAPGISVATVDIPRALRSAAAEEEEEAAALLEAEAEAEGEAGAEPTTPEE